MKLIIFLTGMLVICLSFACSNSSNPAVVDMPNDSDSVNNIFNGEISSQVELPVDTRGVFGAWQVLVDKSTMTTEIIPSRNARAIGDTFDADLSQFLTVSPCSNCLSISQINFTGYGELELTIAPLLENGSKKRADRRLVIGDQDFDPETVHIRTDVQMVLHRQSRRPSTRIPSSSWFPDPTPTPSCPREGGYRQIPRPDD